MVDLALLVIVRLCLEARDRHTVPPACLPTDACVFRPSSSSPPPPPPPPPPPSSLLSSPHCLPSSLPPGVIIQSLPDVVLQGLDVFPLLPSSSTSVFLSFSERIQGGSLMGPSYAGFFPGPRQSIIRGQKKGGSSGSSFPMHRSHRGLPGVRGRTKGESRNIGSSHAPFR